MKNTTNTTHNDIFNNENYETTVFKTDIKNSE